MKKCPRWPALLAAATVILTTTLAPLEGVAAPGPIKLPDDPRYLLGDPDIPTNSGVEIWLPWVFTVRVWILGHSIEQSNLPQAAKQVREWHE